MKYYKKLNYGAAIIKQPWEIGIIYPENSHPHIGFINTKACIKMHPSRWQEVGLQEYATQQLAQDQLVKGAYYHNLENIVIWKYNQSPSAEYYINATEEKFSRNSGGFCEEYPKKYFRIATQEEIDWLEACNKVDQFIIKPKAKEMVKEIVKETEKLDLNNFAIIVKNQNGRQIIKFLRENQIIINTHWSGNAEDDSCYIKIKGEQECVTGNSPHLRKLKIYTLEEFKEAYENMKKPEPAFTLPEAWYVRVTLQNQAELSEWRKVTLPIGYVTGMYDWGVGHTINTSGIRKEHNPRPDSNWKNEITFEQFKKYVLKEEEFVLPKKWKVKENIEVAQWASSVFNCSSFVSSSEKYLCVNQELYPERSSYFFLDSEESKKYTEITFEQFEKYVLNKTTKQVEEKKLIGYKLVKPEYAKAAVRIEGFNSTGYGNIEGRVFTTEGHAEAIRKWYNEDVLDLWFEPVYEEFKAGDWVVVERWHYDSSITLPQIARISSVNLTNISTPYGIRIDRKGSIGEWYFKEGEFRKATPAEIRKTTELLVEIKGYKAVMNPTSVKFGCQTYSKEFVLELGTFLEKSGLKIESENEIMKVVKQFRKS